MTSLQSGFVLTHSLGHFYYPEKKKLGPYTAVPWMESAKEVHTTLRRKRDTLAQKGAFEKKAVIHFRKENGE